MKKKTYIAFQGGVDFIETHPDECQAEYLKLVEQLEKDGYLIESYAKKIGTNLLE